MTQKLDTVFQALSDSTRRAILAQLREGESRLSDLAMPFDMSQTAVSKHVRVLNESGLVKVEKRGRTRYCRLNPSAMQEASAWLEQYREMWLQNFDNLGQYFDEQDRQSAGNSKNRRNK